jgi:hypothetical protein
VPRRLLAGGCRGLVADSRAAPSVLAPRYCTEAEYRAFVPEITARFQSSRLFTGFPTEWHERHNIPYVTANLIALKDPMDRNGGAYFW